MFEACKTGKTEIVKLLLEHYNSEESGLNVKGDYGMTPFMMACCHGHKDVVKLLLEHSKSIDINIPSYLILSEEVKELIHGHASK